MKRDVGSVYYEDRGKIYLFVSGRAIFVVECLLQPTVVGESLGGDGGRMRGRRLKGGTCRRGWVGGGLMCGLEGFKLKAQGCYLRTKFCDLCCMVGWGLFRADHRVSGGVGWPGVGHLGA